MNKTIKQAAEELGISKTAVRKYFSDEFKAEYTTTDSDGRIMISEDGIAVIKEKLTYRAQTKTNQTETTENQEDKLSKTKKDISTNQENTAENQSANQVETTENTGLSDMLSFLQKQLEEKDRQLAAKDEQITNLTAAVENATRSTQAAQALAAADKQLLLEANTKRSWWPFGRKKSKTKAAANDYKDVDDND